MSDYIRPGTQFPQYYQFPEFLLWAPISQTAKIAYMVLYDRTRLSQKNGWISDGRIYTVYPIEELAKQIRKSKSTTIKVMAELEEADLLIRKSGGFSKANILYILLPSMAQFSETVRNLHSVNGENTTDEVENSAPARCSFPVPNKVIEQNNTSKNNTVIQRSAFGRYRNIYLFQEEYDQLRRDYPYKIDDLIEDMSAYCASIGKAYQNYEAALRSWATKNAQQEKARSSGFEDYSCEEGESF